MQLVTDQLHEFLNAFTVNQSSRFMFILEPPHQIYLPKMNLIRGLKVCGNALCVAIVGTNWTVRHH